MIQKINWKMCKTGYVKAMLVGMASAEGMGLSALIYWCTYR